MRKNGGGNRLGVKIREGDSPVWGKVRKGSTNISCPKTRKQPSKTGGRRIRGQSTASYWKDEAKFPKENWFWNGSEGEERGYLAQVQEPDLEGSRVEEEISN